MQHKTKVTLTNTKKKAQVVRCLLVGFLLLGLTSLSACMFAVPFIQGFKDTGLTESDRMQLFAKEMRSFHHSLADGNRTRILAFAKDNYQRQFKDVVRSFGRNEKVVNTTIDLVDFQDTARKAEAEVYVKFFRQTDFLVKERLVQESWEFETGTGWRLINYQVLSDDYQRG